MTTQNEDFWIKRYLNVQFSQDADIAAKNLVRMFTEQYSLDGPFYRGDFVSGPKLKLLNNFVNEHLPQDYDLNGKQWNLQDVIRIGGCDRRSCPFKLSSASVEELAAMNMYPSVLSVIKRYDN
jgi:hypothetical protein